jgi:hypothetical protein
MSQRKSSFGKVSKGAKVRGSVFTSSVKMEGFMKKHSTGMIKRWQRRYFAVKGHYLSYYENENMADTELKGTIDLQNLQAVGLTSTEGELQVIVDGVTTMFRADTKAEAQKWVDTLESFKPNPFFQRKPSSVGVAGAAAPERVEPPAFVTPKPRGSALAGIKIRGSQIDRMQPLQIVVHSATLTGSGVGLKKPIVIVTAKKDSKQHYQLISGISQKENSSPDSLNAEWEETLRIPGIPSDIDLVFTVCDWGENGKWQVMGQGTFLMTEEKWADLLEQSDCVNPSKTKLTMGPVEYSPKDGSQKDINIGALEQAVNGQLSVTITPFYGTYTMCGELCKTGGDPYTSVWKSRWVLLADGKLFYYGTYGDPAPKQILDLKDAKNITHPDNILEMIDIEMPDKLWHFKADDMLLGGQWWWKLRQSAGMETEQSEQSKGISIATTEHANASGRRVQSTW